MNATAPHLIAPTAVFIKASALAKRYATTSATIYKWAKQGKIPSVTFQGTVRFDLEAVRAVIEGEGGK
jgi:predicted DNA-binding transcriptional regulator AlpA